MTPLTIWSTISPTNTIFPATETDTPVSAITIIKEINLTKFVLCPKPIATSSPKLKIVILGAIIIAATKPIPPIIKSRLTPCHLVDVNPPAIQKLNSCDKLKYIEIPIAKEINKVPMAVPANANFTGSTFLIPLELIK